MSALLAFVDRDGTIIWEPEETKQIDSLEKLRILPGAIEGLKILRDRGYALVMVSNQDGRGTASFPEETFRIPQEKLLTMLAAEGITFEAIFICPHRPEENCACRKPKTALLNDFLKKNSMDLERSMVIGDRESDAKLAENLGIRAVRMETNGRFPRFASLCRKTKETDVSVFVNLDGSGSSKVATGIGFLDHMLDLFAKHSLLDLELTTRGDLAVDEHHTTEDTALALGAALAQALGDKRGIERYGFTVPMDDALADVAVDLSGRPYFVFDGSFKREFVGELPTELVAHFFESFAQSLKCNLHMTIRRGSNEHHKIEALFKGLGRCLRQAFRQSPYEQGIPSTKGSL